MDKASRTAKKGNMGEKMSMPEHKQWSPTVIYYLKTIFSLRWLLELCTWVSSYLQLLETDHLGQNQPRK